MQLNRKTCVSYSAYTSSCRGIQLQYRYTYIHPYIHAYINAYKCIHTFIHSTIDKISATSSRKHPSSHVPVSAASKTLQPLGTSEGMLYLYRRLKGVKEHGNLLFIWIRWSDPSPNSVLQAICRFKQILGVCSTTSSHNTVWYCKQ